MPVFDVPNLTEELANKIAHQAKLQLEESRRFKRGRFAQISENENLYAGEKENSLDNPFNEPFPFMEGFVEHYLSKIDDPPKIEFEEQERADFKTAQKISAAFDKESRSPTPNAKWALKDRWAKKMALLSGRANYMFFAESDVIGGKGHYKSNFEVIDHYDFHSEPAGGGHLENHLFCGREGIYKTKKQLMVGGEENVYDEQKVIDLLEKVNNHQYKEVQEDIEEHLNRYQALGLDPESHNYVGQETLNLVEWYTTYEGIRWYVLFDEFTGLWVRVKPLREMFPSERWPIVSWATHEDPRVFWSKAPCDSARPIHKFMTKLLNQEVYNREKQNFGQRGYDPEMVHDVESLASWRPDGLVPFDSKGGTRDIRAGLFNFQVAGLGGTLDLISFLDRLHGQKTGSTPGSQGVAEEDKKVGIFFGELDQVDEFIGVRNKSYTEAWEELGLRYIEGLDQNLTREGMEVKLMGASGIEWDRLRKEDLKRNRPLQIKIRSTSHERQNEEVENQRKMEVIPQLATANPRWKDEEMMKAANFDEDARKNAFSPGGPVSQELMAEADIAIREILNGREAKENRNANSDFVQRIVDFMTDHRRDLKKSEFKNLKEFTDKHMRIAARNEARKARDIKNQANMNALNEGGQRGGGRSAPGPSGGSPGGPPGGGQTVAGRDFSTAQPPTGSNIPL